MDFAGLVKVSQALSGEIVLEKLIDPLMRTAIEHAGAERGLLILPRGAELVVEGHSGRRLAIECDGDQYHTPEMWLHDLNRQRTLERVGWTFWRCWGSSFLHDKKVSKIGTCLGTFQNRISATGSNPFSVSASKLLQALLDFRELAIF